MNSAWVDWIVRAKASSLAWPKLLWLFVVVTGSDAPLRAAEPDPESVQRALAYISDHLGEKREMEQDLIGTIDNYPGWEGFPLKHWRYTTSRKGGKPGRTAEVLLLNPTREQLARWVVIACVEAKGSVRQAYIKKLCDRIIGESGGQFPVAGIVYEDMDGAPFKIYGFRDGITVGLKNIQNGEPRQITKTEIKASLDRGTQARYSGFQARLQSTTRADCRAAYLAAGGTRDPDAEVEQGVVDQVFLDLNRRSYQEGWRSGHQVMMIAWAKAHL